MKYKVNENGNTLLESIYKNRNLSDEYIDSLLYSTTWEEPEAYKNMQKGYDMLMGHIENNNNIGITIDPDSDGYTSAATTFGFIYDKLEYDNIFYIIKKDSKKSHGIDKEIIEKVKKEKFKLLIFPDGGSGDFKYQKELNKLGCDIIVLDHHEFDTTKDTPAVIISNQDGVVENKALSGCGVAYKFVFYCADKLNIDLGYEYLDLVAISLIADMRDMTSLENRYLLNVGTDVSNVTNEMVQEFIKDLKLKKRISIENISFGISNKINSIVRMGSDEEKKMLFESLIGSSEAVEYKYRGQTQSQSIQKSILRIANRLKQKQKKMVEKCISEGLDVLTNDTDRVIIVNSKNINEEIRGLLASKLVNEYNKPVMILKGEEVLRGSCRGINSISFKDLLESSGLFVYCEGHSNSFGCSINQSNIIKFIEYINKELLGVDLESATEIDFVYDEFIPLDDVLDLGTDLEQLWCNQIKRPKLLVKNIVINSGDIVKKGIDLSFKIKDVLYKKDFCSRVFYEDLICIEDNADIDKDLSINMIVEIKQFENGKNYANIVEFESQIID
ncbi:MAG: DHH family phosphoesterase [Sarcina sp.]